MSTRRVIVRVARNGGTTARVTLEHLRYCAHVVVLALHTCDFVKHTCDLNRNHGFKQNTTSVVEVASTLEKIASSDRKHVDTGILKS